MIDLPSIRARAEAATGFGTHSLDAMLASARDSAALVEEVERLDAEVGATLNRLQEAHEEVERLKGLLKQAEYADHTHDSAYCPWCGSEAIGQRYSGQEKPAHGATCPAFTPDGELR